MDQIIGDVVNTATQAKSTLPPVVNKKKKKSVKSLLKFSFNLIFSLSKMQSHHQLQQTTPRKMKLINTLYL